MNLVIVESPTKARTLGRFLGRDYVIQPTMGHIRDLPESKLGVDIEHDFVPAYVLVSKKRQIVKELKKEAKQAGKVYLATDPDREGEAIAYHVASLLGRLSNDSNSIKSVTSDGKFARVVFHEITESAVKHALENPRDIDIDLFHAQQARRVLDRLVGYKLSPLLWRKVRRGLSAGRVQSVTVRLVVEREREIEAFVPEEYWEVFCNVKTQNAKRKTEELIVKLIQVDGKRAEIKNEEQADVVVADLEKADYKVSSVDKREVNKRPPAPFTTSTMAQSGGRNFFWSAKKTMATAQRLYEEGLITYHRTDSLQLAAEAVFTARKFIEGEYGKDFLPEKPRFYKTKSRVAQEAHEAIRPTNPSVTRDTEHVTRLGADVQRLYGLIWRRFVACQMADSVFDETTVSVEEIKRSSDKAIKYLLQATGQVVKFEGWRAVYGAPKERKDSETEEQILPDVQKGDALEKIKVSPEQRFTQAPPRYTEASLIKTLEKLGIGRPSTYAPTISTIQDRQYVEKEEGKFIPTALGFAVNDFLVKYFSDVVDYAFTAHMEGDLDEIARGEKRWVPVIRDFWNPFWEKLEKVAEKAERVKIEVEQTGEVCPKCGTGKQVIRVGKFGKFLSCSTFPECDWKAPFIQKAGMKCPGCLEGDVVVKKTRKGRMFYGCSTYPKCKWASWRKPALPERLGVGVGKDSSVAGQ